MTPRALSRAPLLLAAFLASSGVAALPEGLLKRGSPERLVVLVHNLAAEPVSVHVEGQAIEAPRHGARDAEPGVEEVPPGSVRRLELSLRRARQGSYSFTTTLRPPASEDSPEPADEAPLARIQSQVWLHQGRVTDVTVTEREDPEARLFHSATTTMLPSGLADYLAAAAAAYAHMGRIGEDLATADLVLEAGAVRNLRDHLGGGPPADLLDLRARVANLGLQARNLLRLPDGGMRLDLFYAGEPRDEEPTEHLGTAGTALTFPPGSGAEGPQLAVDGRVAAGEGSITRTGTRGTMDPFWEVDLGEVRGVGSVYLVGPPAGDASTLQGAMLVATKQRLSPISNLERSMRSAREDGILVPLPPGEFVRLDLGGAAVRYLRLQRPGGGAPLGLREALVFPQEDGNTEGFSQRHQTWERYDYRGQHMALSRHGHHFSIPSEGGLWVQALVESEAGIAPSFRRVDDLDTNKVAVAVLPNGRPWFLDGGDGVYRLLRARKWERLTAPFEKPSAITCSPAGHILVGGAAGLSFWDPGPSTWAPLLEAPVSAVAVVPSGPPRGPQDPRASAYGALVVDPEGALLFYPDLLVAQQGQSWAPQRSEPVKVLDAGSASDVASNGVGQVVVQSPGFGELYRFDRGGEFPDDPTAIGWQRFASRIRTVALGPQGAPYGTGKRSRITGVRGFRRVFTSW